MQLSLLYRWLAEAGLLLGKEPAPGILRTINGYGRIWFPSSAVLTLYNGGLFQSAGTKYVAHCTPHRSLQLRNDLSLKSRSFQCNKGLPSEGHQRFPETTFFKLYGIWKRMFFTSCLYFCWYLSTWRSHNPHMHSALSESVSVWSKKKLCTASVAAAALACHQSIYYFWFCSVW